jgi:pSer/pThr/pTyr-binding forkhead associated (FHA) protein
MTRKSGLEVVPTSVRPVYDLVIREADGTEHRLIFEKDVVTIGRGAENDLVLPAGNVSGAHAKIVCRDGRFILADVASTNGTFVNGVKIDGPTMVRGVDAIMIGPYTLQIDESSEAEVEILIQTGSSPAVR